MKVTELGERMRFEVQSTTTVAEKRLVDMCEMEGNGQCSCWQFAKQIKPALEEHLKSWTGKKGTYVPEERHQCDHIQAVNRHIANRLVQTVRLGYPDDDQQT